MDKETRELLDKLSKRVDQILIIVNSLASEQSSSCYICGYDRPLHADDCISPGMRASEVNTFNARYRV